ncbi:MAG TPA: Ig-like domain-containing protein [Polyangiaceae bacterium]|nr:Ig-like domain-containing protein [Polyangiaceae bacterium]
MLPIPSSEARPRPIPCPASPAAARAASSLGLSLSLCACGAEAPQDAFARDAPVVVETTPRDGEQSVDADLRQITATFSEAMDLSGWSWVTETGHSVPSITGLPFYVDDTTTVLPVRLEPATNYAIWVNSPDDAELRKFTSLAGVSARAHRIRFTTRAAR